MYMWNIPGVTDKHCGRLHHQVPFILFYKQHYSNNHLWHQPLSSVNIWPWSKANTEHQTSLFSCKTGCKLVRHHSVPAAVWGKESEWDFWLRRQLVGSGWQHVGWCHYSRPDPRSIHWIKARRKKYPRAWNVCNAFGCFHLASTHLTEGPPCVLFTFTESIWGYNNDTWHNKHLLILSFLEVLHFCVQEAVWVLILCTARHTANPEAYVWNL